MNCYPAGTQVTERKASVGLQALLDHTAARLAIVQKDVLASEQVKSVVKVEFVSKVGFDASTGHSRYSQKWTGERGDENSMLLTALCPLLLHYSDEKGERISLFGFVVNIETR